MFAIYAWILKEKRPTNDINTEIIAICNFTAFSSWVPTVKKESNTGEESFAMAHSDRERRNYRAETRSVLFCSRETGINGINSRQTISGERVPVAALCQLHVRY